MLTKLPEWYRIASIPLIVDTLKNRSIAITEFLKSAKLDWMFNCIRLYLNKEIKDQEFIQNFINIFLAKDPLFPQSNNKLELRVLAGAILSEYIETKKTKDRIAIAMALKSGLFEIKTADLINSDIIESVHRFLLDEAINIRNQDEKMPSLILNTKITPPDVLLETISTSFTSLNENFKNIVEIFKNLIKRTSILEEESNIHWWIFRGYSNYSNLPIKELDFQTAPILLAKELSDLTTIIPGPISSEQFLKKVLVDNFTDPNKTISLKDVVNSLYTQIKEQIALKYNVTSLGNLCPLMFGFTKSLDIDDDKSWISFFEKSTGIKTSTKVDLFNLAQQYYCEDLLVKSLS